MGFNYETLVLFPFGLLLPVITIVYFFVSKNRKTIAYDGVVYGIGAFLGSIVAVVIAFVILNAVISTGFTADDYTSGFTLVSIIFSALIAVLYIFCESFKMMTIKKFLGDDVRTRLSSVGFSAGVIIAQNGVFFVALNLFEDSTFLWSAFSGLFISVTAIMYFALSYAAEKCLALGSKGAAYAISSVYYLMWIAIVLCISSRILIISMVVLFFVLSLVLSAVFIKRNSSK